MTPEFQRLLVLLLIAGGIWFIALFGLNTVS